MLATSKAAVKPSIVLLGQKDPAADVELRPEEGPRESALAVAQDMWGLGNLSPTDNIFATTAIGALAVTTKSIFGVACHHLGQRLFTFGRESDTWIDAYECEPAVSQIQKRPKDKVKFSPWDAEAKPLGKNRFTRLAVLEAFRLSGSFTTLARDCANALKRDGELFVADFVTATSAKSARFGERDLETLADHKKALSQAGLRVTNGYALSGDVTGAIRKGLYNSLNMLSNILVLKEPWKGQRLTAYYRQLDALSTLYRDLEDGTVEAAGILAVKR